MSDFFKKGFWIPEEDNVKIPVAIKVLQGGSGQNESLLEEARIMASVDHPCCVRILAVCMTAQMMLVTQLMPLGSLLDYVRKNKDNVGSKTLLNWCTQIAKVTSSSALPIECSLLILCYEICLHDDKCYIL